MSLPEPADYWAAHREETRYRILLAFVELLQTENPASVSMPAVARRAGISVRTLYRYFTNKDELVKGAVTWFDERARDALGGERLTVENLPRFLGLLWHDFALNIHAVRAQHMSAGGRELRARRMSQARRDVREAMPDALPEERRADLADMIVALGSSSMFLELVDRMGHTPDHAAEMATHLMRLLVADAMDDNVEPLQNGA